MIGTLVNAAAVIAGGVIGLIFKKGIKESYQTSLNKALGVAVIIIGFNGVVGSMFSVSGGKISSNGELLLTLSLVIGTLLGELIGIEASLDKLSRYLEGKFSANGFASGFMNATILFCVGAMAIIGAMNDGLSGDSSTLFTKSVLDFTAAVVLSSTLGYGVIFSFVPLFIYQGSISLFAEALQNILKGALLDQVCMVGYAIIICIGVNFLATTKIKTANMLPAVIIPVLYAGIKSLVALI